MTVEIMSSADLAKVKEVPRTRRFEVGSDDGEVSIVCYNPTKDSLLCLRHGSRDSCSCTSRVRLCGILTHSVIPNVKVYRSERKEA